jgi:lipopolysaccharide/colanic/teichoic acid biosynthesis glycosyltransferase
MAQLAEQLPSIQERTAWLPLGEAAIRSRTHRHIRLYPLLKRALDILVSSAALVALSPILAVIALAIALDSRGSVLYMQRRMGYDARRRAPKEFTIWKFRSMVSNADQSVHQRVVAEFVNGNGKTAGADGVIKPKHDTRVTRVGRFLREHSLDELPQFVNVLKGEMTLVGPRPVPLYEVAQYKPWHWRRLEAVPGITCLWQVELRGQSGIDDMVNLDVKYIQEQSLWTDVKILARTVGAVLSGRGAV